MSSLITLYMCMYKNLPITQRTVAKPIKFLPFNKFFLRIKLLPTCESPHSILSHTPSNRHSLVQHYVVHNFRTQNCKPVLWYGSLLLRPHNPHRISGEYLNIFKLYGKQVIYTFAIFDWTQFIRKSSCKPNR